MSLHFFPTRRSSDLLVKVAGKEVTSFPIAGSRPRGQTPGQDKANAEELLADPKERAEHIMLVDLARNDLGRVCQAGTVRSEERRVGKECSSGRGGCREVNR